MLGNVTKFVWNSVDPRPVYKNMVGAATTAATYESFDTSALTGSGGGLFSSLTSSNDPIYTPIPDFSGQSMGNIVFACRSLITGAGPQPTNLTPQQVTERNRVRNLCEQNSPYFCKFVNDNSGTYGANYGSFRDTFCGKSASASSLLSSMGSSGSYFSTTSSNTYTPIPELSGQSMENIIGNCDSVTRVPIRQPATPEDVAQYNKLKEECRPNFSYFCNYVKDNSGNFTPDVYNNYIKTFCVAPESNTSSLIANVATGAGTVTILLYVCLAIGALLCASIAANQMIYMPAVMRVLVFLIVFSITFINPFIMGAVLLYDLFIIFVDLFRRSKGIKNMNQFIIPATLLPLRLRQPTDGFLTRVLLGPFSYLEPNLNDRGRMRYLAGIDQYVTNLQRGAKLTEEVVAAANLQGIKETIVKGFRDPVEDLTRLFIAKQEADTLQKEIAQKPLNTSKVNRLVELGQLSANNAAKLVEKAGADVINSGYTQSTEKA